MTNWALKATTASVKVAIIFCLLIAFLFVRDFKKMNKKGKVTGMGVLLTIAVIALVSLTGLGAYALFGNNASQDSLKDADNSGTAGGNTVAGASCPDTLKNIGVRVRDSAAAIPSYLVTTAYVYEHETGAFVTSLVTATSGYTRSTVGLCGVYDVVVVTNASVNGGAKSSDVTSPVDYSKGIAVAFDNVDITLSANQLTTIEATIDFMDAPSSSRAGYLFKEGVSVGANATTSTVLNSTNVTTDSSGTAKAIGASGKLEVQLILKGTAVEKSFGDNRLKTYVCIDTGTGSAWDTASGIAISMNGQSLTKKVFSGADSTISYIQQSEACYELPTAFENNIRKTLDLSINARSGQNPGTSDDVTLYFLPQGIFRSTASSTLDQGLVGVATDASSQVLAGVRSDILPLMTIQIS